MIKIKVRYKKGEEIKFTSHRDIMRVFQRALRRSSLPIAYSEGFNPHMKINWGPALKLGKTSENEFLVLQFTQWIRPQEVAERLNASLPGGLEILEAYVV